MGEQFQDTSRVSQNNRSGREKPKPPNGISPADVPDERHPDSSGGKSHVPNNSDDVLRGAGSTVPRYRVGQGQAVYMGEMAGTVLDKLNSSDLNVIREQIDEALLVIDVDNNRKVAEVLLDLCRKDFANLTESKHAVQEELIKGLAKHYSDIQNFLLLPKDFGVSNFEKELLNRIDPRVNELQRNQSSYARLLYDRFEEAVERPEAQGAIARFMGELDLKHMVDALAQALDSKVLPVESRVAIAGILSNQQCSIEVAKKFINHLFPRPYKSFWESLGHNQIGYLAGLGGALCGAIVLEFIFFRSAIPKAPVITGLATLGIFAGSIGYGFNFLYNKVFNKPQVQNNCAEVQLAAAEGLASLLAQRGGEPKAQSCVASYLAEHMDRIKDPEIRGVVAEALEKWEYKNT